ncbi:hypothetical protein ACWF9B_01380 [Streptomyces sp. NPDC055089]
MRAGGGQWQWIPPETEPACTIGSEAVPSLTELCAPAAAPGHHSLHAVTDGRTTVTAWSTEFHVQMGFQVE